MIKNMDDKPTFTAPKADPQGASPTYRKPKVEERGQLRPHLVAGSGPPLPP